MPARKSSPSHDGASSSRAAPLTLQGPSQPRTSASGEVYPIVFREAGGAVLRALAMDRVLYPQALAWNRLLSSGQGRQVDSESEARSWRKHGRRVLEELADSGKVARKKMHAFITAAATSGVVQVEIPWEREEKGWGARIFPWEQVLALATKEERVKFGTPIFSVVRMVGNARQRPAPARAGAVFAITEAAEKLGYNYEAEQAAIRKSLGDDLTMRRIPSVDRLQGVLQRAPEWLHLVLDFYEEEEQTRSGRDTQRVAAIVERVAAIDPGLVVYSSCDTGKRLAPLTVAAGVPFALGFHGMVMDASLPAFFSAFYGALQKKEPMILALRAGLAANALQPSPGDLGCVTLWSATNQLEAYHAATAAGQRPRAAAADDGERVNQVMDPAEIEAALLISCDLEESLNYSVLHNNRGGLFRTFAIRKIKPGKIEPLEISVRLVTGLDQPAECRLYARIPPEANQPSVDLAPSIILPLGSQLMRQRGESILGTVEVTIHCGGRHIYHKMQSVKLLPCDEWRDDETGRHLLPSFVFPRDPAVREAISAAQPYLRALRDLPQAGFDGYQDDSPRSVILQTRAIWSAFQHTLRLDYVNPPPSYTRFSQRLRTPEEILRARRGTCIELSLMLASCWEHVGIYPVIFLTRGHAFAGFWTSIRARRDFIAGLDKLMQHARLEEPAKIVESPRKTAGAGGLLQRVMATPAPEHANASKRTAIENAKPWMFSEPYLLAAVRAAVAEGAIASLETTYIPLQRSYADALRDSGDLLAQVPVEYFEGMLDIQTAREKGVTPMSIIFQGVVA